MKTSFKPLALAAAVAAASAAYSGVTQAEVSANGLGDLAIVPYYTVRGDFVTGVHITNTSPHTQVVKLRLRRASDSMDALDFNLVLSGNDVWAGYIDDSSGNIVFKADDTSCTAPVSAEGRFVVPELYRDGAEEGYIEVIGMGQISEEESAIGVMAKHTSEGVPRDCGYVAQNFFADDSGFPYGNRSFSMTEQQFWSNGITGYSSGAEPDIIAQNNFAATDNVLRVSYFIRDAASGLEFGNDAVHVENFSDEPMMSNQEFGLFAGDITGFDYPDLNGGLYGQQVRNKYDSVIRRELGVASVLNDWSNNSALNVRTDWVVTFPGQYTMLDYYLYTVGEAAGNFLCGEESPFDEDIDVPECDFRDLPVRASFVGFFDREEQVPPGCGTAGGEGGEGCGEGLVVSPSIPGERTTTEFNSEVNVIEWNGADGADSVLGSAHTITVDTSAMSQPYGWAELEVSPTTGHQQLICDYGISSFDPGWDQAPLPYANCVSPSYQGIPMVGFVAWERSFPQDPSANYGRIIEHAFTSAD